MNTELIKKQIKELDTEDKIKDIFVYTLQPDNNSMVFIELDDIFEIHYFKKHDMLVLQILDEEPDNLVVYSDTEYKKFNIDNIDYYINIATFFKENKDKIKQLIKDNL